jgi:hypothetical protein
MFRGSKEVFRAKVQLSPDKVYASWDMNIISLDTPRVSLDILDMFRRKLSAYGEYSLDMVHVSMDMCIVFLDMKIDGHSKNPN